MNNAKLKPLVSALGTSFVVSLAGLSVAAESSPFALNELPGGYLLAQAGGETKSGKMPEGKCAEGKCGAGMRGGGDAAEEKMAEGTCGVMDMQGMVMNENTDRMPPGCDRVGEDVKITVRAGRKYAERYNGTTFGYDSHEWRVPPCAKVTVTFINDDDIRHQWMVHGLPRYIYSQGMFHMELTGKGEKTGTFIAPRDEKTHLVHCDIAQHMEKGMKAQLKVGKGDGDLPSIPGITGPVNPGVYLGADARGPMAD